MSRKLLSATCASALLAGPAFSDAPSVVADIAPVHSLVARVMEGVGVPDLVVQSGASPHEYSLRPSEAAALQNADAVFWVGEDLTPWLENAIDTLASDAAVTELLQADGISLLDFREDALFEAHDHGDHDDHDDHGHEDHAEAKDDDHDHDHGDEDHAEADDHDHDHDHGDEDHAEAKEDDHDHDHDDHAEHDHDDHGHDEAKHEEHAGHDDHGHDDHDHDDHAGHDHGEHDPHAWLSPDNAAVWLNVIAAQLSALDPDNAGTYFANAAAGREEIEALKGEISALLDPARGKSFIVFHDAYQYFEAAFDFPAAGAISLSDASDPSPARIAEIQGRVDNEGVDCVLAEPQYNPDLVATVLEGTDAQTGVLDPLGSDLAPGPDMYPQILRNLATVLAACL